MSNTAPNTIQNTTPPDRYLPIDEEGYFVFDGRRVDDEELGKTLIQNLRVDDNDSILTSMHGQAAGQDAFVEAFDEPLIARHVRLAGDGSMGEIDLPYHTTARFSFDQLSVDDWDRFHGRTDKNIPFVFSRHAQVEFFDLLDSFDDDSITVKGRRFVVGPWLKPNDIANHIDFWSDAYKKGDTRFDQGGEAAALPHILPQLKMSKARILVLGSGFGHDAAYFARQGHNVTAVDFSAEAIAKAKATYGALENLTFMQQDMFQLPEEWSGRFDVVFEHACYCAISPERRNDMVKLWKRLLHSEGYLLGIFFVVDRVGGPPWGGSEWELRERLRKDFHFMFWTRWRLSRERRRGKELVVYARKR